MYLLVNSAALEMRRRCRLIFRRRGPFFIYLVVCLFPCMAVELLSFWAASIIWHQQQTTTSLDRNSTVILLVADPQLIGHRDEPHWIGWLSRWDADRYLHRGYSHAVGFAQPDFEVYLGDLFDEGVHLTDEQFVVEMHRFHGIFPLEMAKNRIYLPGDNDIGGEMEPIYASLFARFRRLFPPKFAPNSASTALKYLTIFQTNPMKYAEFEGIYGTATNKEVNGEGNHGDGSERIRLLLSHAPIVPHMSARVEQELRKIAIVLSGHDHTSALYMQWRQSPSFRKTASAAGADNARWTVSMDDPPAALPLVEFKVPTCSYRMGVPAMGYGLLTLSPFPGNRTAVAHFSVLWLPARYLQLGFYLLMLVVFPFGWALANLAWHCFCRWRRGGGGESQGKKVKMMKRRRKIGEAKAEKKNSVDGATTTDEEKHWV